MRGLTLLTAMLCLSGVDGLSLGQRLGAVRSSGAHCVREAVHLAEARPALAAARASLAPAAAMLARADMAYAADVATDPPVPDSVVVGVALLLVALTGFLQLSLGDIQAEEANLPSSVSLINKNRQKTNSFIKSKKRS